MSSALNWVESQEHPNGGISAWPGHAQYNECTGYLLPTLLDHYAYDLATRLARWLITRQNSDGSWNGLDDNVPHTFDTAACVEGLRVMKEIPGAIEAAKKGEEWLKSMRRDDGVMLAIPGKSESRCYSMRASAIIGDDTPAEYWMEQLPKLRGERSHYIAYCLEGLWRVGKHDFVKEWVERAAKKFGPIMPMTWDGSRDVDYCASAQFGILRAWAGMEYGDVLQALRSMIDSDGAIRLSNTGNNRVIWTMKFYLDLETQTRPPRSKETNNFVAVVVGINYWQDITRPFVMSLREHNPDLSIVLIDNASDKPYPKIKGIKTIRLKKRVGYNLALNVAIKANPGKDWYLLFNNDCICHDSFMHTLSRLDPSKVYGSGWNRNVMNRLNQLDLQWSAWLAISGEAVKEVGLFDPLLTGAYEDFDYQMRAKQKGYHLDTLDIPVVHLDKHTRHKELDYRERWADSREYYLRKWKLKVPGGRAIPKRAWIIGNAPSIANLDMQRLKHEVTFSSNRAYIAYPEWGWYPTYYVVNDARIVEQAAGDINELIESKKIKAFYLNRAGAKDIIQARNVHLLDFEDDNDCWGFDPVNLKYCGDVSAFALQLAYSLGYRDIYLAGVDLDWGMHGKTGPNEDRDHFHPDYETETVRMSPIYPSGHLSSWRKSIEQATAEPYNMSITVTTENSKLCDCLPYVPFRAAA
jgi:GT2 family glycosyltransferase